MSKQSNIPQLRFKGFNGEWENCLLSDVTKYTKGFAFKSDDYQNNGVRIVRVSDLSSDSIKIDIEKVFIDELNAKLYDKYRLRKGNIIITTVGSKPEMIESAVGRGIFIDNENEGLLNQNMLKFENIKNVDNRFIIGLINTKRYQHYMKSIARGNANQANITVVDLLQFEISIPPLPEQEKIASFLSAVDKKIQQLTRKAALLEQYKKGVMQQLFSCKIRFKDENAEEYANWEEKKLGDVADVRDGTHDSPKYVEEGFPFITSKNLMKDGSIDFENVSFITEIDYDKINQRSKVNINDILFGMIGTIGNPVLVKLDGFAIKNVALIKEKKELLNLFLIHFLRGDSINQQFFEQNTGGTQKFLSLSIIRNLNIEMPCIPEQQKIAGFLSGIDEKIGIVQGELLKMHGFKKGLLQQMFV